jgi:lipoprotein-releasing system permease protein
MQNQQVEGGADRPLYRGRQFAKKCFCLPERWQTRHGASSNFRTVKKAFSLFLALRYLKPKRTFLSVITLISIIGVMLGITVLIVVISVMTGFERELQEKVIGFEPHLIVMGAGEQRLIDDWETVAEVCKGDDEQRVKAVAPFVQGAVLARFHKSVATPKVRGIAKEQQERIAATLNFKAGEMRLDGDNCVIGLELANMLGVWVGDLITVYSPRNVEDMVRTLDDSESGGSESAQMDEIKEGILPTDLEVTGIFESGRFLYDTEFLLVPLHIGQELYGLGNSVSGLAIWTDDPYRADEVKEALWDRLDGPALVLTWMDLDKHLFDSIKVERAVMFFLLMFIILVAAFGIMSTLITVTVQKTREIGIMMALGAKTPQIIGVFLLQGMVVGFFGTLTGLTAGILVVQYRNQVRQWLGDALGIKIFPSDVYQFSEIPAQIVPSDVAIICVSAFAICSLAALIPAWVAARLDPVKALRYE